LGVTQVLQKLLAVTAEERGDRGELQQQQTKYSLFFTAAAAVHRVLREELVLSPGFETI